MSRTQGNPAEIYRAFVKLKICKGIFEEGLIGNSSRFIFELEECNDLLEYSPNVLLGLASECTASGPNYNE